MSIGMVLISLSFVVAGFIELWLEDEHLFIAWQVRYFNSYLVVQLRILA